MPKRSTALSVTLPPPVLGWNTKDPISEMDPRFAVEMENYFPNNGTVDMRPGYRYHSKTIGVSNVQTLSSLEYASVSKLVAVGGDAKVYDASTASAAATDISGGVTFATPICTTHKFRDRLFIKPVITNNDVYHYTGTGNIALSGFTGPGGDDKDLYAMGSYRGRMYFGQASAPSLWYGGVDAVAGALTEFPLGSVLSSPFSYILFNGPVSRAKQYTEDSLFCTITDGGEVLLYQGSFPGSATWDLVARYIIPRPVGLWAFEYVGSDLFILTRSGVVSLQAVMAGATPESGAWPTLSQNIETEFVTAYSNWTTAFGIQFPTTLKAYPKGRMLFTDTSAGGGSAQYVMNTTSGAWCKFSNMAAYSWTLWKGELYFGTGSGRVMKFDSGYFDEDPANEGAALSRTTKLRPAYNYLGDRTGLKQFGYCEPIIKESEGLSLTIGADVDYADAAADQTVTESGDTSYKLYRPHVDLQATGRAISLRIDDTVTTKRRSLLGTDLFWKEGDIQR
jgi:hypothetical protein